ncbi:amidohydrolase [bacterium]|nr:amidohydrolase [bacterium]
MKRTLLWLCLLAQAWAQPADLVLRHGAIYQMDPQRHRVQSLAISQGRLLYLGDDAGLQPYLGPRTQVIELEGRMVLPGFCDSHVHPLWAGLEAARCNLSQAKDQFQVRAIVRQYAADHPELEWIIGSGWNLPLFPEAHPTRQLLDELVPDRPAYLDSADGHSAWLNTRALDICAISAQTADPEGGRIERAPDGTPTGCLRENAMQLARPHLPPVPPKERQRALLWGVEQLNRLGVTSFFEACAEPPDLETYAALERQGQLNARVVVAQALADLSGLQQRARLSRGQLVHPDAVKFFLDGVVEARTAALQQPYVGSQESGQLLYAPERLRLLVAELAEAGFQVHMHAIGDKAVRVGLDALQASPKALQLRPTMAHLQLVDPKDLPRFQQLGIVPNIQGYWAMADDYVLKLTNPALGPERSDWQYPIASLFASGARVAAGSDWSVSTPDPLQAIEVALTRTAPGSQEAPWIPSQKARLEDMLAAYTINGAYLCHREQECGSLELGKWADLIVLDRDLFEIEPGQIHQARVVLTLLAGRKVYSLEPPSSRRRLLNSDSGS